MVRGLSIVLKQKDEASCNKFRNVEKWASLVAIGNDKEDHEEVRVDNVNMMISAEAPIVFSKACELFIEDLTRRSRMVTM
ncbi:nuclear transcription factor y subunit c-6 [Quercus suber]|uniref:Nuclear transcription factor y subunit c-6 n=1 Tax=Quercus suber TaxID=58331 RepID=A0AAW0IYV9_QUESU